MVEQDIAEQITFFNLNHPSSSIVVKVDIDMLKLARTLKEVEYPYMLMPDHVPQHPDDPGGRQAFAFCYGYIKSVIQAVKYETQIRNCITVNNRQG